MSGKQNETIADIVAEFRDMVHKSVDGIIAVKADVIADRIDAAWKREAKAIATENAVLPAVCITKSVGNAAKMREALERIYTLVNSLDEECGVDPVEVRDIARAALSAPPRNCDVGTAEEQAQRFHNFCLNNSSSIDGMCDPKCPCIENTDKCHCLCEWAQMPYDEGGVE